MTTVNYNSKLAAMWRSKKIHIDHAGCEYWVNWHVIHVTIQIPFYTITWRSLADWRKHRHAQIHTIVENQHPCDQTPGAHPIDPTDDRRRVVAETGNQRTRHTNRMPEIPRHFARGAPGI